MTKTENEETILPLDSDDTWKVNKDFQPKK